MDPKPVKSTARLPVMQPKSPALAAFARMMLKMAGLGVILPAKAQPGSETRAKDDDEARFDNMPV